MSRTFVPAFRSRSKFFLFASLPYLLLVFLIPRGEDDGSWRWLLDGGLLYHPLPPRAHRDGPAHVGSLLWPTPARELRHPVDWNPHKHFPRRCGEHASPATAKVRDFVTELWSVWGRLPVESEAGALSFEELWAEHVCHYDALDRLRVVFDKVGITRWSPFAGNLMGVGCSGSILPYDKDIDLIMSCADLDRLWLSTTPTTVFKSAYWNKRLRPLGDDGLFMEMYMSWNGWFAQIRMLHTDASAMEKNRLGTRGKRHAPIDLFCYGDQTLALQDPRMNGPSERTQTDTLGLKLLFQMDKLLFQSSHLYHPQAPAAMTKRSRWTRVVGRYLARASTPEERGYNIASSDEEKAAAKATNEHHGYELRDINFGPTKIRIVPPSVQEASLQNNGDVTGIEESFMCAMDGDAANVNALLSKPRIAKIYPAGLLTVTDTDEWSWQRSLNILGWIARKAGRRLLSLILPTLALAACVAIAIELQRRGGKRYGSYAVVDTGKEEEEGDEDEALIEGEKSTQGNVHIL